MNKQTLALHTPFKLKDPYGSLSMPVYHTAAYEFDDAKTMSDVFCGKITLPDYSRVMNPTVSFFEDKVKALTDAHCVSAFNSGMAAISNTFLALASSGKNVLTSSHLFGNTFSLLTDSLPRFGVHARCCDLTDIDAVKAAAADGSCCCIFLEIITNPQLEVADLKALSKIAKLHQIPLIADTTAIPFTEFSSKDLGVDIEIVSSTKYLSGGATSIGGLIIDYGNFPKFSRQIKNEMLFNFGAYMTPHVAYMQTIGLETLNARYQVQAANALTLAKKLNGIDEIKSVNYTGLENNRFHALSQSQFGHTAGAMLTIDLASKRQCFDFLNGLKLIKRATNLFDSKTLAIHPSSTIFGNFTDEKKKDMDVNDTTIRISVGLENPNDLIADILQALNI